jgi:hypothetical protein
MAACMWRTPFETPTAAHESRHALGMTLKHTTRALMFTLAIASLGASACGRSEYDEPDATCRRCCDAACVDAEGPAPSDAFTASDALPSDASLTPNGMLVPACGIAGGAALVLTISDHIPPSTCVADPMFATNTIRIEGGVSGPGSFVSTDASVVGPARLCGGADCVMSNNWQLDFATFNDEGATGSYRVELPGMAINGTFFVNRCTLPAPSCL